MSALSKLPSRFSVQAALCVQPPKEHWPPIQAVRKQHDKAYARWPPHINILFPFVAEAALSDAVLAEVRAAFAACAPFRVRFSRHDVFTHGKNAVVHLVPEISPSDALQRVHDLARKLFPMCTNGNRDKFVPHLTVGQWPARVAEREARKLTRTYRAVEFDVTHVTIVTRTPSGPFSTYAQIGLGGGCSSSSGGGGGGGGGSVSGSGSSVPRGVRDARPAAAPGVLAAAAAGGSSSDNYAKCPNADNPYHRCNNYCHEVYGGGGGGGGGSSGGGDRAAVRDQLTTASSVAVQPPPPSFDVDAAVAAASAAAARVAPPPRPPSASSGAKSSSGGAGGGGDGSKSYAAAARTQLGDDVNEMYEAARKRSVELKASSELLRQRAAVTDDDVYERLVAWVRFQHENHKLPKTVGKFKTAIAPFAKVTTTFDVSSLIAKLHTNDAFTLHKFKRTDASRGKAAKQQAQPEAAAMPLSTALAIGDADEAAQRNVAVKLLLAKQTDLGVWSRQQQELKTRMAAVGCAGDVSIELVAERATLWLQHPSNSPVTLYTLRRALQQLCRFKHSIATAPLLQRLLDDGWLRRMARGAAAVAEANAGHTAGMYVADDAAGDNDRLVFVGGGSGAIVGAGAAAAAAGGGGGGGSYTLAGHVTCIMVPPLVVQQWQPIADMKRPHMNPKVKRPPYPHVTLVQPFVVREQWERAAAALAPKLAAIAPFRVHLRELEMFDNATSFTIFINPQCEPRDALVRVREALTSTLRIHDAAPFSAHVGVAFTRDRRAAQRIYAKMVGQWKPQSFEVRQVYIAERNVADAAEPWQLLRALPLGGSVASPERELPVSSDYRLW